MSYADHARRFLDARRSGTGTGGTGNEINERNEKRVGLHDPTEAPPVWWTDSPAAVAAIVWSPPRECCGPVACSRLGPCDRLAAGRPCRVAGEGA